MLWCICGEQVINGYFMGNPRSVIEFHLIFIIKKMNYECDLSAGSAGKQCDDVLTPRKTNLCY